MPDIMALVSLVCALSTLSLVPTTLAHMQMINPSPFRDPNADRLNEPKDWNILTPLHADGSDFACKGYQWNTPWTSTATYEAGKTYDMELKGGATHGGGSCQLSMSFDRGVNFRVIRSIEGGCPEQKQYRFTVPAELGEAMPSKRITGLFAWTWFNRIGNREMYMNCAVVDIVPPGSSTSDDKDSTSKKIDTRDASQANAAAQAALSSYPQLFVANLAGINDCVIQETVNVIFDNPGTDVIFAGGESASANPSFKRGRCIGQGMKSAGSSSSSSSPPPSSPGASSPGDDGQWHGGEAKQEQQFTGQNGASFKCRSGQYYPECFKSGDQPKAGASSASSEQREAAPVQQANKMNDMPAQSVPEPDAQADHTAPSTDAQIDHATPSTHFHGDKSTPGEDASSSYYFDIDPEYESYYDDIYASARLAKRAACREIITDVKRCHKPNRWTKKGACTWSCRRKGRVAKKPAARPEHKRIAKKLAALERQLNSLVTMVTKNKGGIGKRQDGAEEKFNITEVYVADTTAAVDPILERFLVYLERMHDRVIDCIRYVAATTPTDGSFALTENAPAAKLIPIPDTIKRMITTSAREALVDEYSQKLEHFPLSRDSLPARHEGAGEAKRQLVPPDTTTTDLPTLAFYEYASALSDTITTAIEAWLGGLGPLVHDIAAQLLSHETTPHLNASDLPTGNYSGYSAHEITDALDKWLKELEVMAGEDVKQLKEVPGQQRKGEPPYPYVNATAFPNVNTTTHPYGNTTAPTNTSSLVQQPEGRPAYPYFNTTAYPYINTTTPTNTYSPGQQSEGRPAYPYINTTALTNTSSLDQPLEARPNYPYVNTTIPTNTSNSDQQPEGRPAYPYIKTTAPTSTSRPEQQAREEWQDAIADAQQPMKSNAAAIFPWLTGPGPVLSPGVHVDWPGPNHPGEGNLEKMPKLVDDLGPGGEEEVRKWFEELNGKEKEEEEGGGKDEMDLEYEEADI